MTGDLSVNSLAVGDTRSITIRLSLVVTFIVALLVEVVKHHPEQDCMTHERICKHWLVTTVNVERQTSMDESNYELDLLKSKFYASFITFKSLPSGESSSTSSTTNTS